jgi:hypothetical protein
LGIELSLADNRLRVHAPRGSLTPALHQALARQKAALADLLAAELLYERWGLSPESQAGSDADVLAGQDGELAEASGMEEDVNLPVDSSGAQEWWFDPVAGSDGGDGSEELPASAGAELPKPDQARRSAICQTDRKEAKAERLAEATCSPIMSLPRSTEPPHSPFPRPPDPYKNRPYNPMAVTGFILGIASIFLYVIGIIPLLGIIFSSIGLATFKEETEQGKWMAGWGLGISIVFMLVKLNESGHLPR